MSSPASAAQTAVNTAFQNFITQLEKLLAELGQDGIAVAKPIIVKLGTDLSTAGDPVAALNAILLAQASLLLAGPQLEKMGINQAGAALLAWANSL